MFVCGWRGFRRYGNSKQQRYQPNTCAVAIIAVALGRSMYFLSFPAACSLLSAASTKFLSFDQQPNPTTATTESSPVSGPSKRPPLSSCLVYISLKTFEIRRAVSKNGNHTRSAEANEYNSKDAQDLEPAALRSQNPAGRAVLPLKEGLARTRVCWTSMLKKKTA